MRSPGHQDSIGFMDERDDHARLRADEIREELAIGEEERRMAREEREMEREIEAFDDAEHGTEQQIEQEWRREHWGHAPERPPAWQNAADKPGQAKG
jgi:hypothetical protein